MVYALLVIFNVLIILINVFAWSDSMPSAEDLLKSYTLAAIAFVAVSFGIGYGEPKRSWLWGILLTIGYALIKLAGSANFRSDPNAFLIAVIAPIAVVGLASLASFLGARVKLKR